GLPLTFRSLLTELIMQGVFAAPEYGGNRNLGGWRLIHYEGDSQPLGYSIFDPSLPMGGDYHERSDFPNSRANPGTDPEPMDARTRQTVEGFTRALGGRVMT